MGKIIETLMQEARNMENDASLRGLNPVNTLIIMQFKTPNGSFHTHYRLPNFPIAKTMFYGLFEKLRDKGPLIIPGKAEWLK